MQYDRENGKQHKLPDTLGSLGECYRRVELGKRHGEC